MRLKLIDNWRKWYKMWSMQLAAFASAAWVYLLANPNVITDTLNQLPPEARTWISPMSGVIMFSIIWALRMIEQVKKEEVPNVSGTTEAVANSANAAKGSLNKPEG